MPASQDRAVAPGRFPLLTDENISGPIIEGLQARGWDLVRTVDLFGERSVDDTVFAYAAEQRRVLVSTDEDCLAIARRWLEAGRTFRLVYWPQRKHQGIPVTPFLVAFDDLAADKDAFVASVEYLDVRG